jgi:hypothetical protein
MSQISGDFHRCVSSCRIIGFGFNVARIDEQLHDEPITVSLLTG